MKKSLVAVVCAAAVAVGAAFYFGKAGQTDKTITAKVDSISSELTKKVDALGAQIVDELTDSSLDSLATLLDAVKWQTTEGGGNYDAEAKKKFVAEKQKAAKKILDAYKAKGIDPTKESIKDPTKITE